MDRVSVPLGKKIFYLVGATIGTAKAPFKPSAALMELEGVRATCSHPLIEAKAIVGKDPTSTPGVPAGQLAIVLSAKCPEAAGAVAQVGLVLDGHLYEADLIQAAVPGTLVTDFFSTGIVSFG